MRLQMCTRVPNTLWGTGRGKNPQWGLGRFISVMKEIIPILVAYEKSVQKTMSLKENINSLSSE